MIVKIVKTLAIVIFFLCGRRGSAYLTLSFMIKSEATVELPDLVGKDILHVLETLTDLGVNIKVKGSEYSRTIPKNHVISQSPKPGSLVKEGRDVRIVFSKGEETILMPNLQGISIEQATIILSENDLIVNVISKAWHDSLEEKRVIAQTPGPGTIVKRKTNADLLISGGPIPVIYKQPDFTGMNLEDAILLIEKKGLAPGNISSVYQPDVPKNMIVAQDPLAGYAVRMKSSVNLVVNRSPQSQNRPINLKSLGIRLFRYKTDRGFLKKHIRVDLNVYHQTISVIDDFIKPNQEIWISVPGQTEGTLLVYENEELVLTKIYDPW